MIPTRQRIKHDPENGKYGDCHRAVIASILEMPIDGVPHFAEDGTTRPDEMYVRCEQWLHERGLATVDVVYPGEISLNEVLRAVAHGTRFTPQYYILGGTSRAGCGHSVVCFKNEILHDPSGNGIVGPLNGNWWITFITARHPQVVAKQWAAKVPQDHPRVPFSPFSGPARPEPMQTDEDTFDGCCGEYLVNEYSKCKTCPRRKTVNGHKLYEKHDPGASDVIKDRNGDIALGLCIICNAGERQLEEYACPMPKGAD